MSHACLCSLARALGYDKCGCALSSSSSSTSTDLSPATIDYREEEEGCGHVHPCCRLTPVRALQTTSPATSSTISEALHLDCEVTRSGQFCLDRCYKVAISSFAAMSPEWLALRSSSSFWAAAMISPLCGAYPLLALSAKKENNVERSSSETQFMVHSSQRLQKKKSTHLATFEEDHGYSRRLRALVLNHIDIQSTARQSHCVNTILDYRKNRERRGRLRPQMSSPDIHPPHPHDTQFPCLSASFLISVIPILLLYFCISQTPQENLKTFSRLDDNRKTAKSEKLAKSLLGPLVKLST